MAQSKSQEEKEGRFTQALTRAEGAGQALRQEGRPPLSQPYRRKHARGEKFEEALIKLNLISLALTGGAILALLVALGALVVLPLVLS